MLLTTTNAQLTLKQTEIANELKQSFDYIDAVDAMRHIKNKYEMEYSLADIVIAHRSIEDYQS